MKKNNKRIVVKIGTSVLTDEDGSLSMGVLNSLLQNLSIYHKRGYEFILVSSGSIAMGRHSLNTKESKTIKSKQAYAAIGQVLLMKSFEKYLDKHDIPVAQVLLSAEDFANRKSYLNLKATFEELIKLRAVTVINENDSISTHEIYDEENKYFGDNDKLSAIVASKLNADLLVILSNVNGIYTSNPEINEESQLLKTVTKLSELNAVKTKGMSMQGRGGMRSKLEAVKIAFLGGVSVIVANGNKKNILDHVLRCDNFFTDQHQGTFISSGKQINKRKHWIGYSSGVRGSIVVNKGAIENMINKNSSLLAVGISQVKGRFSADSVVSVVSEDGFEFARGLSTFSSDVLNQIKGLKSSEIKKMISSSKEVIHKDNLVVFKI